MSIKLKFNIEIPATRPVNSYAERKVLKVAGTRAELRCFLHSLLAVPDNLGLRLSFESGKHETGVYIHSKKTFDFNPALTDSIKTLMLDM